uniref:Uncharacterized protein n=1 Tax=Opuntia streptacantha TaxID=393608 RepID=A0A7C8ZU94_OPUST
MQTVPAKVTTKSGVIQLHHNMVSPIQIAQKQNSIVIYNINPAGPLPFHNGAGTKPPQGESHNPAQDNTPTGVGFNQETTQKKPKKTTRAIMLQGIKTTRTKNNNTVGTAKGF